MATISQPTLFSTVAAALHPSSAASQQNAEDIYRTAVQNVRQGPELRNLPQDMVHGIVSAPTIEELTQTSGAEVSRNKL
jgi:hypothetical protein